MSQPKALKNVNLEIGLFLRNLRTFFKYHNVIDECALDALVELVSMVDLNTENINIVKSSSRDENELHFWTNLGDEQFEWCRFLKCHLCDANISLVTDDVKAHIFDHKMHEGEEQSALSFISSASSAAEQLSPIMSPHTGECGNDSYLIMETEPNVQNSEQETNDMESGILVHETNGYESINKNRNDDIKCYKNFSGTSVSHHEVEPKFMDLVKSMVKAGDFATASIEQNLTRFVRNNDLCEMIYGRIVEADLEQTFGEEYKSNVLNLLETGLKSLSVTKSIEIGFFSFGSRLYGVGLAKSDFNVMVVFNNRLCFSTDFLMSIWKRLFQTLLQFREKFEDLTPLNRPDDLKILHKKSRHIFLIKQNAQHCFTTSMIIKFCMDLLPSCRYIVLYLQMWQEWLDEISEHRPLFQFSSYILATLVIVRLQMRRLLPTKKGDDIHGTKSFEKKKSVLMKELHDIRGHIMDFFEFYGGEYQHEEHVIGRGILVQRNEWKPECMSVTPTEDVTPPAWIDGPMCVEGVNWMHDSCDSVNITSDVSKSEIVAFQKCCSVFAQIMRHTKLNICQMEFIVDS